MSMLGLGLSVFNQSFDRLGALDSSKKCWEMDGANEYIAKIAHDSVFNHASGGNSKFSISFWMKGVAGSNVQTLISKNGDSGSKKDWDLYYMGVSGVLIFTAYYFGTYFANIANIDSIIPIQNGDWYHIALTYDGTVVEEKERLSIYINGVLDDRTLYNASNPAELDSDEGGFSIGSYYSNTAQDTLDGRMDEVFYVNRYVFSEYDIGKLYNGNLTWDLTDYLPGETRAYWKMGDGSDEEGTDGVKDSIGSNHLTTYNMESSDIKEDAP